MKTTTSIYTKIISVACFQLVAFAVMAQTKYHAKDNIQSLVSGTSTLHAWSMQTSKGECSASFTFSASDQLTGITALTFSLPAAALKSEHKAMDKNAYKALKTDQYTTITYVVTGTSEVKNGQVKCTGKLTISGKTLDADLTATARMNPDKSIAISGTKKVSMKDFDIDPPTFMLGTVKTGNDITLKFDLTLARL